MVIGCGSVGSEVIHALSDLPARWTLLDSAAVSIFNPLRQWFGTADIGLPKVDVLQRRMSRTRVRPIRTELRGEKETSRRFFDQLLTQDPPDVVLLSTGTADHLPLAQVLWRRGIAHVAACAYPQARYFEVCAVSPAERTPCLSCLRGHLYAGPQSAPPLRDEVAQLLYQNLDDEQRQRVYTDLVAEPATCIETGRIADVTAMVLTELLAPSSRRSPWFTRMLANDTNLLLGANTVQQQSDGSFAFGLSYTGQVIRLGRDDIVGTGRSRQCRVCGRTMRVVHRVRQPVAPDEAIARALLD